MIWFFIIIIFIHWLCFCYHIRDLKTSDQWINESPTRHLIYLNRQNNISTKFWFTYLLNQYEYETLYQGCLTYSRDFDSQHRIPYRKTWVHQGFIYLIILHQIVGQMVYWFCYLIALIVFSILDLVSLFLRDLNDRVEFGKYRIEYYLC